ncbi:MAG: hypothetical protein AAF824_11215 [Bacteroidota bacterium]
MKRALLYIFLSLILSHLYSQEKKEGIHIIIGYLGQVGIHPGGEVGLQLPLAELAISSNPSVQHSLVLIPKVGLFFRGRRERSLWVHTDLGILRRKEEKHFTSILGVGVGYLGQSTLESESVNLGTGEISGDSRMQVHYIIPTLHYEVGSKLGESIRWYTKLSAGPKLGAEEVEMALFLEAGIKLLWPNN